MADLINLGDKITLACVLAALPQSDFPGKWELVAAVTREGSKNPASVTEAACANTRSWMYSTADITAIRTPVSQFHSDPAAFAALRPKSQQKFQDLGLCYVALPR